MEGGQRILAERSLEQNVKAILPVAVRTISRKTQFFELKRNMKEEAMRDIESELNKGLVGQVCLVCSPEGYFPQHVEEIFGNFLTYLTVAMERLREVGTWKVLKVTLTAVDASQAYVQKLASQLLKLNDEGRMHNLRQLNVQILRVTKCTLKDVDAVISLASTLDQFGFQQIQLNLSWWDFCPVPTFNELAQVLRQHLFDNNLHYKIFRLHLDGWYDTHQKAELFLSSILKEEDVIKMVAPAANPQTKAQFFTLLQQISLKKITKQTHAFNQAEVKKAKKRYYPLLSQMRTLEYELDNFNGDKKQLKAKYQRKEAEVKVAKAEVEKMITKEEESQAKIAEAQATFVKTERELERTVQFPVEKVWNIKVGEFHSKIVKSVQQMIRSWSELEEIGLKFQDFSPLLKMSNLRDQLSKNATKKEGTESLTQTFSMVSKAVMKVVQKKQAPKHTFRAIYKM